VAKRTLYGKNGRKGWHQAGPYEAVAANYRQQGRRFPEPYAAAIEDVSRFNAQISDLANSYVGTEQAYSAADVMGRRRTLQGVYGKSGVNQQDMASARQRFGYVQTGERSPFFTNEWDKSSIEVRNSGRLVIGDKGFNTMVPAGRPWITINCAEGAANLNFVAQMSGGATFFRNFMVGGGWTAEFYLPGFETVGMRINDTVGGGNRITYSWTTNSVQEDQNVYLAEVKPAGTYAVPTGAYEYYVQNTDANWDWDCPALPGFIVNVGTFATWPGAVSGQKNLVMGSRYTSNIANSILWVIKPI
jgi:hypothetical protein